MIWPRDDGKDVTPEIIAEAQRLTNEFGLNFVIALSVARGRSHLDLEIERLQERIEVDEWVKGFSYEPGAITPQWDLDPEHFYLSLDGEGRADFAARYPQVMLITVDLAELMSKLQYASGRAETPEEQWKSRSKTKALGYRWHLKRGVTPPFLYPFDKKEIGIRGGMHRVHLAAAEGATAIPSLVEGPDFDQVAGILRSARQAGAASTTTSSM